MKLHTCLALLFGVLCLPHAAAAQPAPTEYAVIVRDMPLKALPGRVYYQIGQVSQGDVVEVLEERYDWALVRSQLKPVEGYVPASAVGPGESDDVVITTSRVQILAPDRGGVASSLFALTVAEPGVSLPVVERFRENGAQYLRVIAPASAGGWLPLSALGPASEDQSRTYRQSVAELTGEALDAQPAPQPETPAEQPAETGAETPADDTAQPAEEPDAATDEAQPTDEAPPAEPQKSALELQAEEAGVMTPAQLAKLTQILLAEDIRVAEFDPALHEYERTADALDLSESQRKALDVRRRTLEIRQRVQESLLRAEGALAAAEEESEALARQVDALKGKGVYNLSGKLLPSTVYTGANLPKLYRLQSLATLSTRTRAYVDPGTVEGIQRYIDKVVGVTGPVRFDEALGIFIIIAEDVMLLEDQPAPQ